MIITWMIIMIPLQQVVGVLRLQATNNDDNDVSIIDNHASNYEKIKKKKNTICEMHLIITLIDFFLRHSRQWNWNAYTHKPDHRYEGL